MATATKGSATGAAEISYDDLYRRWEHSNWSATELDFSQDREGWRGLTEMQRRSALWMYSMFFYGEDSVTDNLSPYIDAAPREEQKYFLATQQVDEARHAILFHRFFKEVIGAGDGVSETLAATLPQLGWGYRKVFERLDSMADELRADRSLPKFAQAITLYHLIVEGTLAQPGQHFIEDFFTRSGVMPAFAEGMGNVARDEQRHIGFGVKVLSEILPQSDECKAAVVELLREVTRYSVAVFYPPGFDRDYTECYGFTLEDIYAFGLRLIRQRWRTIGYPIEEMPADVFPYDHQAPPEQIAARQVRLLQAGITSEPRGRPDSDHEVMALYFETMARSADARAAEAGPFTCQWRFTDAEPWFVRVERGRAEASQGLAAEPDFTIDTDWGEWIGITMHDKNPLRSIAARRLRPRGSARAFNVFRKTFRPR